MCWGTKLVFFIFLILYKILSQNPCGKPIYIWGNFPRPGGTFPRQRVISLKGNFPRESILWVKEYSTQNYYVSCSLLRSVNPIPRNGRVFEIGSRWSLDPSDIMESNKFICLLYWDLFDSSGKSLALLSRSRKFESPINAQVWYQSL